MIFKLLEKCYLIYDMDYVYITILFLICVVAVNVYHFVLDKKIYKLIFALAVAALIIIALIIRGEALYDIYYSNYVFNFNAIWEAVNSGAETYFTQYQPYILIFLPIILIMIISVYNSGFRNFILIIDLVYIIILWFIGYSDKVTSYMYNIVFIGVATYSIHLYYRDIQKSEAAGIKIGKKSTTTILYIVLTAFIIACVTRIMPQDYKGKYNSFINSYFKNSYAENNDSSYDLKGVYDLTFSGYDENNRKLGGPITPDGSIVFRVQSKELYYLRGAAKDYYDGSRWKKTDTSFKKFTSSDEVSSKQRFLNYMNHSGVDINHDLENSISSQSISVYPNEFKTSTVFTPLNVNSIISMGSVLIDRDKTFLNKLGSNVDYNYDVIFCESPVSVQNFPDLYKQKTEGNIIDYTDITGTENYKDYKNYMQVPDNITDRTKELVKKITEGCTTNDEKVFKIQQYLSKTYPYSMNVSSVPDSEEFIDYFLFTEKKGYCTYFATTTTIFCRLAGIPARYVEGFHMAEDKDDQGRYLVTNDKAHAWTEVLVSPENNLWAIVDCVPNAYNELKKSNRSMNNNSKPVNPNINGSSKNNSGKNADIKNKKSNNGNYFTANGFLILKLILILFIMCVIIRILLIEKKRRKLIKSKNFINLYKHSLKRLKQVKIVKNKEDTELEFALNIVNPELRLKLKELVPIVYEEYYGNKLMAHDKFDKKVFCKFIEKYIRERQNLVAYLLTVFFTY